MHTAGIHRLIITSSSALFSFPDWIPRQSALTSTPCIEKRGPIKVL
jgi:hypothetical protein